jgi:hypothetical protein
MGRASGRQGAKRNTFRVSVQRLMKRSSALKTYEYNIKVHINEIDFCDAG